MSTISNQSLLAIDEEFSQNQPDQKKETCPPPSNCCLWFTIVLVVLIIIINIYSLLNKK